MRGQDGVGVASAYIDAQGQLIITLTDGTQLNAGAVGTSAGEGEGPWWLVYLALGLAGVACSLDKVIIGGIIPLVPGVALTNGIRDVANCDYLSGTIRAIDAVLIAAGIALGVGLVLKGAALLPGVTI